MKKTLLAVSLLSMFAVGCARIESGEVGLRVGFDKQINLTELQPGSFNQTIVGEVLTFPVRDIRINLDDMTPQTADNSTLKDFDISVIYNINPSSVGEIYSSKSRGLHQNEQGDIYLLYSYVETLARSAAYKAVRKYNALQTADNRAQIEQDTAAFIRVALAEEKLDKAVNITQIQVRNVQPADEIIRSANEVLRAQNDLKTKEIEVQTAKKEAERLQALANSATSIRYMEAKALADIAEGVKLGKVTSIVIPYDFKGILSVGK